MRDEVIEQATAVSGETQAWDGGGDPAPHFCGRSNHESRAPPDGYGHRGPRSPTTTTTTGSELYRECARVPNLTAPSLIAPPTMRTRPTERVDKAQGHSSFGLQATSSNPSLLVRSARMMWRCAAGRAARAITPTARNAASPAGHSGPGRLSTCHPPIAPKTNSSMI